MLCLFKSTWAHRPHCHYCGFTKNKNKDVFNMLSTGMDAIGPFCTQLGIWRFAISDGLSMPSVRDELCHGAVIELVNVYDSAHNILHCLFPEKSAHDWKAFGHKIAMQAKRLRTKRKTKLGVYLWNEVKLLTFQFKKQKRTESLGF